MKLGISTACFYGKEHVEDALNILRDYGITTTEVFLNTFSEYEKDFVEMLCAKKGEIKVHSVHAHGTCFEPELFSIYDRIREDAEQIFRKVCLAAFMLGAKFVTFHGPFVKKGRELNINYETFAAKLNHLCDIAESYGVQIAYENVNWAYFDEPDFFRELAPLCPKLKATLDIKQAYYSDIDVYKFLDAMGDRLVTVHLCDMDAKLKPVMPLKGKFNFEKLFKTLKETHPDITMLLEVYEGCYDSYDDLKNNYDELNEILKKFI